MQDKILRIVTLLLILIFGWVSYRAIITPKREGAKSIANSLKNIDFQINRFLGEEVALRGGSMQAAELKKELEQLSAKIPSEKELPRVIDQVLTRAGQGLKISYNFIEPKKAETEGKYKRVPVELEFVASYADFNTYISQLKKLPELIRADKLRIQRLPDDPTKLSVYILLSTFFMPKEEEENQAALPKEIFAETAADTNPFQPIKALLPAFTGRAANPEQFRNEGGNQPESAPAPRASPEVFVLTGVILGAVNAALINDSVVYLGDKIGNYQLVNVKERMATLKSGQRTLILKQKD